MAFKVVFTGGTKSSYSTKDRYEFLKGGVLAIIRGHEGQWTEYYAPHQWEQVLAERVHWPGAQGGGDSRQPTR